MVRKSAIGILVIAAALNPALMTGRRVQAEEAQATPAPKPPQDRVMKIIQVKYADVRRLAELLSVFGGQIRPVYEMKALSVYASPAIVTAVEEAVRRLDVVPAPVANVELTVYLLQGSKQKGVSEYPPELEDVARQLKGVLGLERITLLETSVLRGQDDSGGRLDGLLPGPTPDDPRSQYQFGLDKLRVIPGSSGRKVRMEGLGLRVTVPVTTLITLGKDKAVSYRESIIQTDLEAAEGQTAVVGKTTISATGEALILVVKNRIL